MWKTTKNYAPIIIALLILMVAVSYSNNKKETPKHQELKETYIVPQIIKSVDLKKDFTFADEPVPLDNFDVRERLDRELTVNTYWHSSTLLNIKSTYKYFPVIEPILAENGVPDDFKYLAVAESNLRNVTSPAGAKGIWQFLNSIGQHYGLEINSEVDERYHIEKATAAACEYLKDHYREFGSWTLTAAAYNMGGPKLNRELSRQRADSYYDLNLNIETGRYVFRIVAIKEVMKNPRNFGFYLEEEDAYPPLTDYEIVEVNTSIESLGDFAVEHGTTYRMLKVYNPWLLSHKLTNRARKTYQIKVPTGSVK